jgi:hypothetical protein
MTAQENSSPKTVVTNRASLNNRVLRLHRSVLPRLYDDMGMTSMPSNIRSSRGSLMEQRQLLIETTAEAQKILMSDEGDGSSSPDYGDDLFSSTFPTCQ